MPAYEGASWTCAWQDSIGNRTRDTDGRRPMSGKESIEQDRVDGDDGGHHAVGRAAVHESERTQERRDPETDDPRIEAHADAPERFGVDVPDHPGAERHADDQTRHDERHEPQALERVQ